MSLATSRPHPSHSQRLVKAQSVRHSALSQAKCQDRKISLFCQGKGRKCSFRDLFSLLSVKKKNMEHGKCLTLPVGTRRGASVFEAKVRRTIIQRGWRTRHGASLQAKRNFCTQAISRYLFFAVRGGIFALLSGHYGLLRDILSHPAALTSAAGDGRKDSARSLSEKKVKGEN